MPGQVVLCLCVTVARGMEIGAGGVWDSPLATDYWVKRFGFMWGGGSSGMSGLKAMQVTQPVQKYNQQKNCFTLFATWRHIAIRSTKRIFIQRDWE